MAFESDASFETMMREKAAIVSANLVDASSTLRQTVAGKDLFTYEAMESCLTLLDGGKKLRGILVLIGSELHGDHNESVAVEAAGAIELCHTHLLVLDDVHDDAKTRRNKLAAHKRQGNFIAQHSVAGDAEKRGIDMVQTAGFAIHTHASHTLLNLDVAAERSNLAVRCLNRRLFSTGLGQLSDLSPVTPSSLTSQDILQITADKTAYYTFLLPLEIGASLAGATEEDLVRFHDYSLNTGLAFQLRDDIIGTFGDPSVTGKPRMSDIIEDKKTFLRAKTLELASATDRKILLAALGNKALQTDHFYQCREIISRTGALQATNFLATQYAEHAVDALHRDKHPSWPQQLVNFLSSLALYSVRRKK